jgi:hypothetical protein
LQRKPLTRIQNRMSLRGPTPAPDALAA